MLFKETEYTLVSADTGREFKDEGWMLEDPCGERPSLIRANYATKEFTIGKEKHGLFKYASWLPIVRRLRHSSAPVTYKSKGLSNLLGLENLYITFSGYNPKIGANMTTCSFKETEAFSVCARIPKNNNRILVIASAGNTARAFARVCSDNRIPVVIVVPEDNKKDLWFTSHIRSCVKVVCVPKGHDYFDAITLADKICKSAEFFAEGGAKNIARRDGMGTTLLSAVETIGRIPDAYFQSVGSGTGAIAAWEAANRIAADGHYGENKMRIYPSQNVPFTLMYDSWKADSREILPITAEDSRLYAHIILAKVLGNRKPPYSLAGGLYDVLKASNGDMFKVTNDEIVYWLLQFLQTEDYDIFPAAACAVASLAQAVKQGVVKNDETIMLNITGGGSMIAMKDGYIFKEPDLILNPEMEENDIIRSVKTLF